MNDNISLKSNYMSEKLLEYEFRNFMSLKKIKIELI
jgi:hypothetical protein